jgi:3-hydroxyacyl-CoA dehydrogenase
VHLAAIADNARDVDFAMRWGFGMKQGPFELWQEAGWQQVAEWVKADIDAGKALSSAPLPAWVFDGRTGVHTPEGSWSPSRKTYVPRSSLPVYQRQYFPRGVLGSNATPALKAGTEVFKNDEMRAVDAGRRGADRQHHQQAAPDRPGVDRRPVQGGGTGRGRLQGPGDLVARRRVLGRRQPRSLMPVFMKSGAKGIAPEIKKLQDLMLRMRYAQVPVVSAMRGLALGGGCELAVYCARAWPRWKPTSAWWKWAWA